MSNPTAVTPGRHTVLELDPTGIPIPLRPTWSLRRSRAQIHPASVFGFPSVNVRYVDGLGWSLMEAPADRTLVLDVAVGGHVIDPSEVTTPVNIGTINTNPLPSILNLPGVTNP